jgi:phosphoglycerate dehydrogenase-like enzyme
VQILFLGESFANARVAVANLLPEDEVTCCRVEDAARAIRSADVVVPGMTPVGADLIEAAGEVVIHQFGGGLDAVDIDAARARGIVVARLPTGATGNAVAVAELAIMHLLALARQYPRARDVVLEGGLGEPHGRSLVGMPIVVVGLGQIGSEIVSRLSAFHAHVVGVGRADQPPDALGRWLSEYVQVGSLIEALRGAGAVILSCGLNDQTRGLIDAEEIAALAEGAFLVNVARGPIVDYGALLAGLRSGHLGGAGLDVFWNEPFDPEDPILREAVTTTPHVGAATVESHRLMAQEFAANVERLRRGEGLLYRAA